MSEDLAIILIRRSFSSDVMVFFFYFSFMETISYQKVRYGLGLAKYVPQSMSEEQQRYVREGFSSDEELSIYDLLFSENLSKSDIEKIKKVSVDLLSKIKERIAGMDHWTDKQETRAAVEILIRDVLFEEIPDSMFNRLEAYRKAIFEHIYTHYKGVA